MFEAAARALPVGAVLDDLAAALDAQGAAVLAAPPGAGKTTLVPLKLLDAPWRGDGRIILLEPRRLAARAAARRMADLLGEEVGDTVGYRMRLDTRISKRTRIEVVTEGVFVRMILDDPELSGIAAVIFDEFHERALDADFALALVLDVRAALRADLRLLVMSATLDTARVSALIEAPVIESAGRAFPVEMRYRERRAGDRIEDAMAEAIRSALAEETGSILAFLPGQAEIRRTAERLEGRLSPGTVLAPLFGMMDGAAQDRAIRPAAPGSRKIVLATSIAETSLTIDGVRVVIDSGLQRLPHFEPATGITRLETVRVSRASADQRAGRAGRTEPGVAIRLWRAEQTAALPAFTPPEILSSDLSGLILDSAAWGVPDPTVLAFIDPPPAPALKEARALLVELGALDPAGGLTAIGRAIRGLGLPARLAAMVASAPRASRPDAADIAVLLTEQGLGGPSIDVAERLRRWRSEKGDRASAARELSRRIVKNLDDAGEAVQKLSIGGLLALAYPDRVARNRGGRGRYLMANGRGAELDPHDPLAGEEWLVIADLTGRAGAQRIQAAAAIDPGEVETLVETRGVDGDECMFDTESRSVRARHVRRLGAIVLEERAIPVPTDERTTEALADGVRRLGVDALPWSDNGRQLRARLGFLNRSIGDPWPAMDDDGLVTKLAVWFTPYQSGVRAFDRIAPGSLTEGLMALAPYDLHRILEAEAPTHFVVPTGSRIPIRYDGDVPVLAVRVQELFGLASHPTIAKGRLPLLLELLSPAHRPIQTTRDLPGFWAGSWADVRADMRGRYPKHPWPEDPARAEPTRRAKPRGS
ncbi:ATP-dependent helicase HrpB [Rhizobium sp. EC-SD404]|uniref:ATP-dependent helicase HrpB n=1 Tax=Rhizobium sp. EC-SD404 TaxID=2038389 RepID=UPI0012556F51|nr:ATP-dependent helicase HrpB [Rhizobium sp. EC-SD404]VVT31035.1 ATP-dependent RNA helicase HrpB [Rhizobium sp. EC-SD404]